MPYKLDLPYFSEMKTQISCLLRQKLSLSWILAIISLFTMSELEAQSLNYQISFEPNGHYAWVQMDIKGQTAPATTIKMAVWTPGSYLVREYSKNVDYYFAKAGDADMPVEKTAKNTWRIKNGKNQNFSFRYRVYCNELTVRNAYIDDQMAYINPAAVFMWVKGWEKKATTVQIKPLEGWTSISTALDSERGNPYLLKVPDLDTFIDSPIQVGKHKSFTFKAAGVVHEVAMVGKDDFDAEKLSADFTKIVETQVKIFGEHPCKRYVFIVHNLERGKGGGGLEHKHSTTVQTYKKAYDDPKEYSSFLGLIAHEYFHLWNVKRLRPEPLGPFDYENENYTSLLWIAEGFTAYYDDLTLYRAGLITEAEYLKILNGGLGFSVNALGGKVQSLHDASFDAWIKGYRPNENSNNISVTYYTKGSGIAFMLDVEIARQTKGEKGLDDLMRALYNEFYKGKDKWFTEADFKKALTALTGKNYDSFFKKYIQGTERFPIEVYLGYAGFAANDANAVTPAPRIGMRVTPLKGGVNVAAVEEGGPAYKAGIYYGDVILLVYGNEANPDNASKPTEYKIGDEITYTLLRDGAELVKKVVVEQSPYVSYNIDYLDKTTPEQEKVKFKWLKK